MADPRTAPEELLPQGPAQPERALGLLRRRDFRRAYAAVAISELGDAFQYIALMWFAFDAAGPLGVVAVRLADSVPALRPLLSHLLFAVGTDYASDEVPIPESGEVVAFPPVSGG